MDSRNFDSIVRNLNATGTRRKALLSLAAGGLSLGFLRSDDADAKKKHKRKKNKKRKNKRCLTLGSTCTPGGKRRCCDDLSCKTRAGNTAPDCCKERFAYCETAQDCCEGACLPVVLGSSNKHCVVL
jgi:hypothetical protein